MIRGYEEGRVTLQTKSHHKSIKEQRNRKQEQRPQGQS